LRNRKLALVLSFIYCGLGQIYNRQILKGVDLIIIYTMLFIAAFSSLPWLRVLAISILPFMWLIGMADAYISRNRDFQTRKWLVIISVATFISILVFVFQVFFIPNVVLGNNEQSGGTSSISEDPGNELSDASDMPEELQSQGTADDSGFFSIQAATFRQLKNAEKLRDELLYKGYPARIEDSSSEDRKWYRVLVGRYQTRGDSLSVAKELRERERIFYMIVHYNAEARNGSS